MSRSSLGGDSRRLKQIFLNPLSIAIKFTLAGSRITLDASIEDGGGLKIAVADTGIGIEPGDLSRILLPFEQVEDCMKHTPRAPVWGWRCPSR